MLVAGQAEVSEAVHGGGSWGAEVYASEIGVEVDLPQGFRASRIMVKLEERWARAQEKVRMGKIGIVNAKLGERQRCKCDSKARGSDAPGGYHAHHTPQ